MNTRTIQSTVMFLYPFRLEGMPAAQPAGLYRLITDQEELNNAAHYRTIMAFIELPAVTTGAIETRLVALDMADLDASVRADRLTASAPDRVRAVLETA